MVVEVSVDGEAMASDLPLVAGRAPLPPSQDAGVALRPEELSRALTVLCPINSQYYSQSVLIHGKWTVFI